jgi:hypothetical protein
MKTKNIISTIAVIILAIGGYKIYQTKFWQKKKLSKKEAIEVIVGSGNSKNTNNALDGFDSDFLIEWANGIIKNNTNFLYKGKSYKTLGGKSA